jgi:uncharacterized protein Usg
MTSAVSEDFRRQLEGYGLTSAKIFYTKPDAPWLINPNWLFWQDYDLCPHFPGLFQLLNNWQKKLDGKPVIVRVAHANLIKPAEIRMVGSEFRLH